MSERSWKYEDWCAYVASLPNSGIVGERREDRHARDGAAAAARCIDVRLKTRVLECQIHGLNQLTLFNPALNYAREKRWNLLQFGLWKRRLM